MAVHKVVCVTLGPPANARDIGHPVALGTETERWTAEDVLAAMELGETFVTRRPGAKGEASVLAYECRLCGRRALRSGPEAEDANRLDRHPPCRSGAAR